MARGTAPYSRRIGGSCAHPRQFPGGVQDRLISHRNGAVSVRISCPPLKGLSEGGSCGWSCRGFHRHDPSLALKGRASVLLGISLHMGQRVTLAPARVAIQDSTTISTTLSAGMLVVGVLRCNGILLHAGKGDEHACQQAQPQAYGDHAGNLADDLTWRGMGVAFFHAQGNLGVPRMR